MNVLRSGLPKLSEKPIQPSAMQNSTTAAAELQTPNWKGPLDHKYDALGVTGYDFLSMYLGTMLTNFIFLGVYIYF